MVASIVLSRGLHISGTWPALNSKEYSSFSSAISKTFRRILPPDRGIDFSSATTAEVQDRVGHLVPMNYLRIARISLFSRICRDAQPLVLSLLWATRDAPRSWVRAVMEDLEFVAAASEKMRSYATASLADRFAYFRKNGKQGVRAICAALEEKQCNFIHRCLPRHTISDESHVCNVCGDAWSTKSALAAHLYKAHRRPNEMRRYIPYPVTICEVCLLERHSRRELVRHFVHKSPICGANIMLRYKPANLRVSRYWDQQALEDPDRIVGKHPPAFRYPGPLVPVIGVDSAASLNRHVLGGRGHRHYAL